MKTKHNATYWLIILLCFDFIFLKGLILGDIHKFLHPKMQPFIILALIIFLVLTFDQVIHIKKSSTKLQKIKFGYLIYVVPIVIAMLNPQALGAEVIANRSQSLGVQKKLSMPKTPKTQPKTTTFTIEMPEIQSKTNVNNDPKTTKEDLFFTKVMDMQENLGEYIGQKVTLKGFVFKSDLFEKNQFVIARLWVNCCVADAGVLGIMIESTTASDYNADDWIEVTGVIAAFEYHDTMTGDTLQLPILKKPTIISIPPLETPYVYQ